MSIVVGNMNTGGYSMSSASWILRKFKKKKLPLKKLLEDCRNKHEKTDGERKVIMLQFDDNSKLKIVYKNGNLIIITEV